MYCGDDWLMQLTNCGNGLTLMTLTTRVDRMLRSAIGIAVAELKKELIR